MMTHALFPKYAAIVATLALSVVAGPAMADRYDALRADAQIESGVLVAAIGDIVRDNCPNIEERRIRSGAEALSLARRAQSLGYSMAEIRAYVEDDAEKNRVKAKARQWFAQQGVAASDSAGICRVAQQEIAKGSSIGRLMRVR